MIKLISTEGDVDFMLRSQDSRLLLVISNFKYLSNAVIPSMLSQLESAFGISMSEDRKVSVFFFVGSSLS